MASFGFIDWTGYSGRAYRYFFVYGAAIEYALETPGNYCFAARQPSQLFVPVYFGIAGDLSDRLPRHEKMKRARAYGEIFVMAHATPAGDAARRTEERDLIQFWNPPLNYQHRSIL